MMRMSVKLPDLSRINYSQEVGVVIGDSFLTKERFKSWFNELLNAYNTTEYIEFARSLKAAVNNSTKNEDGRFNFTEKLASLQAQFLKFTTKTSI
jgi:hypothetical protein